MFSMFSHWARRENKVAVTEKKSFQKVDHKTSMLMYLYDLCERLRGGLGQQSQTESAVQFSDGSS